MNETGYCQYLEWISSFWLAVIISCYDTLYRHFRPSVIKMILVSPGITKTKMWPFEQVKEDLQRPNFVLGWRKTSALYKCRLVIF